MSVFCKSPWLCRACSAARILVLDGALQVFRQPSSCMEKSSGDRVLGTDCTQTYHCAWYNCLVSGRHLYMFGIGYLFIRIHVFKPARICKLFEERRHLRGGFPWWWRFWNLWTARRRRRSRRRSRSFGLLYWRNDLRKLQGQEQINT